MEEEEEEDLDRALCLDSDLTVKSPNRYSIILIITTIISSLSHKSIYERVFDTRSSIKMNNAHSTSNVMPRICK